MSTSDSKTLQLHNLVGDFYSRKLLVNPASPPDSSPEAPYAGANNTFDANVVMVLSVLLCALICSLGINSIIRCVFRCSNLVANDSRIPGNSSTTPVANSGIKKKALKTFPTISYSGDLNLPGLDTECAICLSEFTSGEKVRLLPKCNHGFHVRCIDKWLSSHSSCPKCRHCLIETCNKIVGSTQRHETIIPLQPEAFIRTYRGN